MNWKRCLSWQKSVSISYLGSSWDQFYQFWMVHDSWSMNHIIWSIWYGLYLLKSYLQLVTILTLILRNNPRFEPFLLKRRNERRYWRRINWRRNDWRRYFLQWRSYHMLRLSSNNQSIFWTGLINHSEQNESFEI